MYDIFCPVIVFSVMLCMICYMLSLYVQNRKEQHRTEQEEHTEEVVFIFVYN